MHYIASEYEYDDWESIYGHKRPDYVIKSGKLPDGNIDIKQQPFQKFK